MSPRINWEKAIDNAISKYGLKVEPELIAYFQQANVQYPPAKISLLAFKQEKKLELWADHNDTWTYIHTFPLTAYSGKLGPKLKENDYQIPEGIYQLVSFNPFSTMHLSMMINYPNAFDKALAKQERRRKLGNNIFLHGKAESVGCLAIGNKAIDQLFTLARKVGLKNISVIIAPNDLRKHTALTDLNKQPKWVAQLYRNIKKELTHYTTS
jgi:murein L,D-transpeptidase YafK